MCTVDMNSSNCEESQRGGLRRPIPINCCAPGYITVQSDLPLPSFRLYVSPFTLVISPGPSLYATPGIDREHKTGCLAGVIVDSPPIYFLTCGYDVIARCEPLHPFSQQHSNTDIRQHKDSCCACARRSKRWKIKHRPFSKKLIPPM